jgi:hypothetical protein
MKLAHIITPVKVEPSSDLYVAQPITFETMRRAKAFANGTVDVELYTTQYPEDHPILPHGFTILPDLLRSVLDTEPFEHQRKLPILADILQSLAKASDADYFIYTNVDISLLPHFYVSIATLLSTYDALVINRRTIPDHYTMVSEIPVMYTDIGIKHPGHDCFVFRRETLPKMQLGTVCIGARYIGFILYLNLLATSTHFQEVKDAHFTFHIGDNRVWKTEKNEPYLVHNRIEAQAAVQRLRELTGPFKNTTPVGKFLLSRYRMPHYEWLGTVLEADNSVEVLKHPQPSSQSRARIKAYLLKGMKPIVRKVKKILSTTSK